MFIFKSKKVVVDLLVSETNAYALKLFPPKHAKYTIPSWFKSCPKSTYSWELNEAKKTVKGCVGIRNYLTKGFVTPLFSDINIKTSSENIYWNIAGFPGEKITYHDTLIQSPNFYTDFFVLKVNSPWLATSKKRNVELMTVNAQYHSTNSLNFTVFQGVTNIDVSANLNFFMAFKKENAIHELKAGEILNQWVPLSYDDVEICTHVVSEQEYLKKQTLEKPFSFCFSGIKRYNILRKGNT